MKLFRFYKPAYRGVKSALAALPLNERFKNRLVAKLRLVLPDNRRLMKGVVSPVSFSLEGERFILHFRDKDEGDLGIVKCLLRGDLYEPEVVTALKNTLKPDDVVIDGGAHIGYISLAASRFLGNQGKIFSFEPFEPSFRLLSLNIAANGRSKIIHPVPQALWNSREGLDLAVPVECSVSVKRWENDQSGLFERARVETVDIDSFCREKNIFPALIKLDVEGAEVEALAGARNVLEERRSLVILELNEKHYRRRRLSLGEFLGPLLKSGYKKCYILSSRPRETKAYVLPGGLLDLEGRLEGRNLNCLFQP
jgi:FkbM family methyltransferase